AFWCWSVFAGFCAASIFGSLNAENSAESMLLLLLILVFAGLSACYLERSSARITRVHTVLISAILVMIGLALVHLYGVVGFLRTLPLTNPYSEGYNVVILKKPASGFLLLLPLCGYVLWRQSGVQRLAAGLAIVGIVWLIVISESRSAMAGVAAILCIAGITSMAMHRWHGWQMLSFILVCAALVGAIVTYLISIRGHLNAGALGLPGWAIDLQRQILWNKILVLLQQDFPANILTGYGINALDELGRGSHEIRYSAELTLDFPAITTHPHNWMLEVLVEVGMIGFLAVLSALAAVLWWAWQHRHTAPDEVVTLLGLYAAFCTASLFNYSVWSVWWQIAFATMNGLCCAMIRRRSQDSVAKT
ncbi:MAG: O-antigen ligase family protein, partial [Alphaproteobacteria bacterium]|nr:O-antigen ligase family protein [Alphaproteobacteria bacterium]